MLSVFLENRSRSLIVIDDTAERHLDARRVPPSGDISNPRGNVPSCSFFFHITHVVAY